MPGDTLTPKNARRVCVVEVEGSWTLVPACSRRVEPGTVCAYCGVGCDLTLHVQDNEIVKVTSPHDNPVTHGNLCIKGRFGYQHVQNRD